jgi:hypothetical protein
MMRIVMILVLAASLMASMGNAAEPQKDSVDEDAIFTKESTVTPTEKVKDDTLAAKVEQQSLALNGFINARYGYLMDRDWMLGTGGSFDDNTLHPWVQGDFTLDARLLRGMKGFANVSLNYYPNGTTVDHTYTDPTALPTDPDKKKTYTEEVSTTYCVDELFVDFNFGKAVYFRAGKQVLKWGVGTLWSPTDLINIEKKNILDSSQVREGVSGIKMHIPFGTRANIYSFVKTNNADNLDGLAVANKLELLLGRTEVSVSALFNEAEVPVYGADFTSRILTVDIHGEATASYGDPSPRLRRVDLTMPGPVYLPAEYRRGGEWVYRASAGFGRGFDVLDVHERVRLDAEFFYNGSGYREHMFNNGLAASTVFVQKGYYEPNYYGVYYAGLFCTVSQVFTQDLSLALNYISNLTDGSSVASGMISYTLTYNFTLGLMVNGFLGRGNREYTAQGNAMTVEFSAKIIF